MFLRDWLYLGFNEDESHRSVFDAVQINTSGTQRLFANVEFADPNTYSREDSRHDFLSTSFPPYTFAVTKDPISGIRDGILKRPSTDPLVFEVDTANEFWNMRASLNVADGLGHSVPIPKNVRLYFLPSFSHRGVVGLLNPPMASGKCLYRVQRGGSATTLRALLIALDAWADKGIAPPKSNYPRLDNGTLVPHDKANEAFPKIPAVSFPQALNQLELLNFGSQFNSQGGRLTILPPSAGAGYKLFVPLPDQEDGLDTGGIRILEVRVPLGTNVHRLELRSPGFQAPDLCELYGSYFPFARTSAERLARGDPRESLGGAVQEPCGVCAGGQKRNKGSLIEERFLLPEDAEIWVRDAAASDVLK